MASKRRPADGARFKMKAARKPNLGNEMKGKDLENLLRVVKLVGGKFVLVEDGEPRAVIMSYKEFEELVVPKVAGELAQRVVSLEDSINQEITEAQLEEDDEIHVEPLPF